MQEGLASKLELDAIYELVGDKLREIFRADTTFIGFHDEQKTTVDAVYYSDRERKGHFERPYGYGTYEAVVEVRKTAPVWLGRGSECTRHVFTYKVTSPGAGKGLKSVRYGCADLSEW